MKSIREFKILKLVVICFVLTSCLKKKTSLVNYKKIIDSIVISKDINHINLSWPLNHTKFPMDFHSPIFIWKDKTLNIKSWIIEIKFKTDESMFFDTKKNKWTPTKESWDIIKKNSLENNSLFSVYGVTSSNKILSKGSVKFSISKDKVSSPIFFREVPLPFAMAVNHVWNVKFKLANISSYEKPKTIFKTKDNSKLYACLSCHSFSSKNLKMVYTNKHYKGIERISLVEIDKKEQFLKKDNFINISKKSDPNKDVMTFFSAFSPNGNYIVSEYKTKNIIFGDIWDKYTPFRFNLKKSSLVTYSVASKKTTSLNGANNPNMVYATPAWSSDGLRITFAAYKKNKEIDKKLDHFKTIRKVDKQVLEENTLKNLAKFDLYSVDFNAGKGGEAIPLKGASKNGYSNYYPRYSPNGKWMAFTTSSNGASILMNSDSKINIIPAKGGEKKTVNFEQVSTMNSWHSWSPNSKWLLFVAKLKEFGPYTQMLLTHIDDSGKSSPPVLLHNLLAKKTAANIPEFVNISYDKWDAVFLPTDGLVKALPKKRDRRLCFTCHTRSLMYRIKKIIDGL